MLATLFQILWVWLLLGLIVGLLVTNTISVLPEEAAASVRAPNPGTAEDTARLGELEEDKTLDLARAQTRSVE